jgi:endonuclease YncB( thermonuclease family)|tara:strand:- start:2641 stop:3003 length:363 start_codon:yes stop_codon:yes gene_type:complete
MYEYNAELRRVVDGDTVDVTIDCGFNMHVKERVRLKGINTPECRTRDLEEKEKGLAAKARLIEILEGWGNKMIIRTSIDKKGKFGRLLGELISPESWSDDNANKILLKEGHAVEYHGGKR